MASTSSNSERSVYFEATQPVANGLTRKQLWGGLVDKVAARSQH
jgi:hypothetical protein